MTLYDSLVEKKERLALVGLGYVGLPIAIAFAKKINVIGFDTNRTKIELYKQGIDPTNEVGDEEVGNSLVNFTYDEADLKKAKFFIVAVPTPVNRDHTPNLSPVKSASEAVGRNLVKGSIVVYESTVYPGVTEEVCVPILEKESGLKCGVDFKVGYSPERINPGDKNHRLNTIVKIVSGMDGESLDEIAKTYELVVDAGVHRAESIKVAEAAKVIENSQRDINIAFMNELSIIFDKMNIDTLSVLKAAGTKWNFLDFKPGLVGGHCIGVDPYYLTYKANLLGVNSQVILAGRQINDSMGKYVAENCVKLLIKMGVRISDANVAILGFTFKEDCPDTRNTRVKDIIDELQEYGINPMVVDPIADAEETKSIYGIQLDNMSSIENMDVLLFATAHKVFKQLNLGTLSNMFRHENDSKKLIIDVKGLFDKEQIDSMGINYWRL